MNSDPRVDYLPVRTELRKKRLVDIAPAPVLSRLEGFDERVLGGVKMLGRVLVLGRIAAAYVPADQALAKMNPAVPHVQALLAAFSAGSD